MFFFNFTAKSSAHGSGPDGSNQRGKSGDIWKMVNGKYKWLSFFSFFCHRGDGVQGVLWKMQSGSTEPEQRECDPQEAR